MKKTKLLCMLIIAMLTFSMTAEVTVLPASAKVSANKTTKKSKKKSKKKTKKSKKKTQKKAKNSKTTKKAKKTKSKKAKSKKSKSKKSKAKKTTNTTNTKTTATNSGATVKPADVPSIKNDQVVEQAAPKAETETEPQAAPEVPKVEETETEAQAAPAAPKVEAKAQAAPAPAAPKVEAEAQAAPAPAVPKVETKAPAAPKAETEPQPTPAEPETEEKTEPQPDPTPAPAEPEVCEHNWDWKVIVEPGCTSVGYKIQTCTTCGETKGSRKIIDPLDHVLVEVEEESVAATCLKKGKITQECTRCGKRFTQSTGYGSHKYEEGSSPCEGRTCTVCGRKEEIVGIQGHDRRVRVIAEPTCNNPGKNEIYCARCGETLSTEEIPATGYHSYGSWTTVTAATCEKEGQETATCTVCGETKTRTVACLSHTWATRVTKEPTCGVEGSEEDYCTVCGKIGATHTIPTTGHKLGRRCAVHGCHEEGAETCTDEHCHHYVDTCVYCGARLNEDGTWTPQNQ